MWYFNSFIGQAITIVIIATIAFSLVIQKNWIPRLIGGIFCLLIIVQLVMAPSVLAAISLTGMIYVVFLVVRTIKRSKTDKKAPTSAS
jgi:hypothetical protein